MSAIARLKNAMTANEEEIDLGELTEGMDFCSEDHEFVKFFDLPVASE